MPGIGQVPLQRFRYHPLRQCVPCYPRQTSIIPSPVKSFQRFLDRRKVRSERERSLPIDCRGGLISLLRLEGRLSIDCEGVGMTQYHWKSQGGAPKRAIAKLASLSFTEKRTLRSFLRQIMVKETKLVTSYDVVQPLSVNRCPSFRSTHETRQSQFCRKNRTSSIRDAC